jgi:hypothetical protein
MPWWLWLPLVWFVALPALGVIAVCLLTVGRLFQARRENAQTVDAASAVE